MYASCTGSVRELYIAVPWVREILNGRCGAGSGVHQLPWARELQEVRLAVFHIRPLLCPGRNHGNRCCWKLLEGACAGMWRRAVGKFSHKRRQDWLVADHQHGFCVSRNVPEGAEHAVWAGTVERVGHLGFWFCFQDLLRPVPGFAGPFCADVTTKSGTRSCCANQAPMMSAFTLPRSFNGRSVSSRSGFSQDDLAWRMRRRRFII